MVKECCKKPENLDVLTLPDRTVSTCRVCGCRHIRVSVDPLRVGLTIKGPGG